MTRSIHNGIPATKYNLEEVKTLDFFEKYKDIPVSILAERCNRTTFQVKQALSEGQRLREC